MEGIDLIAKGIAGSAERKRLCPVRNKPGARGQLGADHAGPCFTEAVQFRRRSDPEIVHCSADEIADRPGLPARISHFGCDYSESKAKGMSTYRWSSDAWKSPAFVRSFRSIVTFGSWTVRK